MNYKLENTMKRNIIYLAGIALCAINYSPAVTKTYLVMQI